MKYEKDARAIRKTCG